MLGDTSELRIIEQLMSSPAHLNISELAKATQVSRPTAHKAVRKLLECGVLEVHSSRGNTRFYGLSDGWDIGNVVTKVRRDDDGGDSAKRIQSPVYDRER